ncbi:septum formation initiator, partial [Streptomyces sp. NPDC047980]
RGAKRIVRMWERLQIRKAEETVTLVNRFTRNTEIQPPLIQKITGTRVASAAIPANFKELQASIDSGRLHELDAKSTVKQALWGLAGELGIVKESATAKKSGSALVKKNSGAFKNDRGSIGRPRRRRDGSGRGPGDSEGTR